MIETKGSLRWITILTIVQLFISPAIYAKENRVALVIGNGKYENAPLKNPVNDANDIGNLLQKLGFQVISGTNLSRKELRQNIREFGHALQKADVGFFYFAGHGVQFNGENYLIPISADMQSQEEVVDEAISVSSVLRKMEIAGNAVNIVVLDACRNNPFESSYRSGSRGLTRLDGPTGSYIAYATAPGKIASDGRGKNGLYTQHLLQYMQEPGLTIEQVFKKVRVGVIGDTGGKQIPWENSSLLGDFYFVKKSQEQKLLDPNDTINYELRFWKSADKSASRSFYQAYLEKYPNGHFTDLARSKLKKYEYGHLTIRSNVFGDRININGDYRGSSQLDIELTPGKHLIEVSKKGYETYQTQIVVKGNQQHLINVQLRKGSSKASEPVNPSELVKSSHEPSTGIISQAKTNNPIAMNSPSSQENKINAERLENNLPIQNDKDFLGIEMIKVKSGCFHMGSDLAEEGRLQDELLHEVCISQDFWLGKYEVTQQQWMDIMGKNPAFFKGCGKDCPIENVSWNDVQTFIFRLNNKTGLNYRLPTEAEWEYAARAASSSAVYTENPEWIGVNNVPSLDPIAWYSGNSGVKYIGGKYCEDWDDKQFDAVRCGVHPVGIKKANSWGFYDMIGNVWEWTNDRYGSYSSQQKHDPKGAKKGYMRVTRGGNWRDSLQQNRAAARYGFGVRDRHEHIGFRLAR